MATYYIRNDGNNANAGTGPTSGAAWQTFTKALGATGIASGDTLHVAPGRYAETFAVAMTSATAETVVRGDVDGSIFTDVTAGPVVLTAHTGGVAAAAAADNTIDLAGRDFLTFEDVQIVGGAPGTNGNCVIANTATSTNVVFRRCVFYGGSASGARTHVYALNAPDVPLAWLFDSCVFEGGYSHAVRIDGADSAGASDYDVDVTLRNCLFVNGAGAVYALALVSVDGGGAGAGKPGGGKLHNCTTGGFGGVNTSTSGGNAWSTSIPAVAYNNLVRGGSVGLAAAASGQIVENFNVILCGTRDTNVTDGANSKTQLNGEYLVHVGQEWLTGRQPRPPGAPYSYGSTTSPLLGFGSDASVSLGTDLLGRPRPAGGQSTSKAVGALERHDTAAREASVVDGATYAIKLTGPADQDMLVPVTAALTTITVRVRYDTNHGTGNKPQAVLTGGGALGVADETVTATAGVDTWETLTFAAFTPTAPGIVTVRLVSRSAAGNGAAYFDTLTRTP